MGLSNSRITDIVQQTQQNIALSLRNEAEQLKQQSRSHEFDQTQQINYLLTNHMTGQSIQSLEELNHNWLYIRCRPREKPFLVSPIPSGQNDKARLLNIMKVQLEAIARGYKTREQNYSRPEPNQSAFLSAHYRTQRPIQRVYYYGGYQPYRSSDFLTDMLLWDMLTHHHHHGGGWGHRMPPPPHTTSHSGGGSSSSDDKKGEAILAIVAILALCAALVLAAVTVLYMIGALYSALDEIIHFEKLPENLLQLTGSGLGAWGGIVGGVALGAALSLSGGGLVLLGLCTAIIGSGLALFAANQLFTGFHMATNRSSAIDSDPRFQLSYFEKRHLNNAGYDITSVQEAIREVGLLMKQNKSWHLTFWSDQNSERKKLVTLLRDLKTGHGSQYVNINGKAFDLWQAAPPLYQSAPPIYVQQPPNYGRLISHNVIQQRPPAYAPPPPSAPPPDQVKGAPPAYNSAYNQAYSGVKV